MWCSTSERALAQIHAWSSPRAPCLSHCKSANISSLCTRLAFYHESHVYSAVENVCKIQAHNIVLIQSSKRADTYRNMSQLHFVLYTNSKYGYCYCMLLVNVKRRTKEPLYPPMCHICVTGHLMTHALRYHCISERAPHISDKEFKSTIRSFCWLLASVPAPLCSHWYRCGPFIRINANLSQWSWWHKASVKGCGIILLPVIYIVDWLHLVKYISL